MSGDCLGSICSICLGRCFCSFYWSLDPLTNGGAVTLEGSEFIDQGNDFKNSISICCTECLHPYKMYN